MVYPANAFDSRLRGDQVPLGSSPTKSQKRLFELAARNRLSLSLPLSFSSSSYFLSFSKQKSMQGVLVGIRELPPGEHFFTDFMFASLPQLQASSHVQSRTPSSTSLTDLRGRSGFFHFSNFFYIISFIMVIKRPLGGESAGCERSTSGIHL